MSDTTYEPAGWVPVPGDFAEVWRRMPGSPLVWKDHGILCASRQWWGEDGHLKNPLHVRRLDVVDPALGDLLDATDAMIAACDARVGTKKWSAHGERVALVAARDAVVAALGGAS